MRIKSFQASFRPSNSNAREPFKVGGKIPHSSFRNIKDGGVSYIPGTYNRPKNIQLSAIPPISTGGQIRRRSNLHGNGFFDDVGAWFRNLFTRSNTNQIALNILKKTTPFVTNLANDILADEGLTKNPFDVIKKHTVNSVKKAFDFKGSEASGGAITKKPTNDRAKKAYKKYLKTKKNGGAILTD